MPIDSDSRLLLQNPYTSNYRSAAYQFNTTSSVNPYIQSAGIDLGSVQRVQPIRENTSVFENLERLDALYGQSPVVSGSEMGNLLDFKA